MNKLSEYYKKTCQTLSEGMMPGAYNKLKEAFPKYFDEINDKLDQDFTESGIDEYRETMVRGFKKVDKWGGNNVL